MTMTYGYQQRATRCVLVHQCWWCVIDGAILMARGRLCPSPRVSPLASLCCCAVCPAQPPTPPQLQPHTHHPAAAVAAAATSSDQAPHTRTYVSVASSPTASDSDQQSQRSDRTASDTTPTDPTHDHMQKVSTHTNNTTTHMRRLQCSPVLPAASPVCSCRSSVCAAPPWSVCLLRSAGSERTAGQSRRRRRAIPRTTPVRVGTKGGTGERLESSIAQWPSAVQCSAHGRRLAQR